jgi:small subunit ribosomal protein S29
MAQTEYSPVQGTEPPRYSQPIYIIKLLQATLKANPILKDLKLSKAHPGLSLHLPPDATLADLAALVRDQDVAWPALKVFWEELTTVEGRPPVLLSLDGLVHIMGVSAYRDPALNLIHAHDLTLVGLFADAISGKAPLVNGGAVIGALTRGNCPNNPSVDLAIARAEARASGLEEPKADPWNKKYDARSLEALGSIEALRLKGISRDEARVVMEYWAASGVLRSKVSEATIADKWTLGGNGVFGEMERISLLNLRV